jgi:hypothetical protein
MKEQPASHGTVGSLSSSLPQFNTPPPNGGLPLPSSSFPSYLSQGRSAASPVGTGVLDGSFQDFSTLWVMVMILTKIGNM